MRKRTEEEDGAERVECCKSMRKSGAEEGRDGDVDGRDGRVSVDVI